jgi:hypothetical protein
MGSISFGNGLPASSAAKQLADRITDRSSAKINFIIPSVADNFRDELNK